MRNSNTCHIIMPLVSIVLAIGLLVSFSPSTNASQIIIDAADYPPGVEQVQAIQEAVDNGGEILLRGTFDFNNGSIAFGQNEKDVILKGEKDAMGNHLTEIIDGGNLTIVIGMTNEFMPLPRISVEIRDLHFKNFFRICIGALRFTGLKIVGNMFTGGRLEPRDTADPYSHPLCIAMLIGGYRIFPATDCTGEVIVENNIIYGQGFGSIDMNHLGHHNDVIESWGFYWSGISNGVTSRDLVALGRYKSNRFYDILSTPIASHSSQGETVISHNIIKTLYSWSGNGIIVRDQSIADIRHNETQTVGAGIFLWSANDISIKSNDMNIVQDPLASIPRPFPKFRTGTFIYESDNNIMQGNKISGNGEWGVWIENSNDNVLVGNNIKHFSSTGGFGLPPAHALTLDADTNTFVGGKYSLLNIGQNNNVTGGWEIIDPYGFDVDVGAVGQEISEAMQRMNDLVP